jgi:hypothetical protein
MLQRTATSAETMDKEYLIQATKALENGDLKLSIILLRHVKKQEKGFIKVLVESAYFLWRSQSREFTAANLASIAAAGSEYATSTILGDSLIYNFSINGSFASNPDRIGYDTGTLRNRDKKDGTEIYFSNDPALESTSFVDNNGDNGTFVDDNTQQDNSFFLQNDLVENFDAAYDKQELDEEEERIANLKLVKNAYTRLLSRAVDPKYVVANEYIRLSHIYISEGALEGALRIMQLASARGHMQNILIVAQTWSLLTRTGDGHYRQAMDAIGFIAQSVAAEQRAKPNLEGIIKVPGSDLNMVYLLLHGANHLRIQATMAPTEKLRNKLKIRYQENFMNIITEAFQMHNGYHSESGVAIVQWFSDPQLWYNMAIDLESSSFVLLAEESHWECFLRSVYITNSLERVVMSMQRYHRHEHIRKFLEAAYDVSPWNTFVRDTLVIVDINDDIHAGDKNPESWADQFIQECLLLTKLQQLYRTYKFLIRWHTHLKNWYVDRKENFIAQLPVVDNMYALCLIRRKKEDLLYWRQWTIDMQDLKYLSANMIQAHWRRKSAMRVYHWARYRSQRANYNFIPALQLDYDFRRTFVLRKWQVLSENRIRDRSAYILSSFLTINGKSKRFFQAIDRLKDLLRIQKYYGCLKAFTGFIRLYHIRQKKHARIKIRFWIRNIYNAIEEKFIEAKLEAIAAVAKNIEISPIPLYKSMWAKWRDHLAIVLYHKSILYVAKMLPRIFNRLKARRKYLSNRVRYEGQLSTKKGYPHRKLYKIVKYWQTKGAANRIQRCFRCYFSKKLISELRAIRNAIHEFKLNCRFRKIDRTIFLMKKFVYLIYREKFRASRWIVKLFRKIVIRGRLRTHCRRKLRVGNFSTALNLFILRKAFFKAKGGSYITYLLKILCPMFETVKRCFFRNYFNKWRKKIDEQAVIEKLIKLRIYNRLNIKFWVKSYESAIITKKKCRLKGVVYSNATVPWETIVEPSYKLLNFNESLDKMECFKKFVSLYRHQVRNQRIFLDSFGKICIDSVVQHCFFRQRCAIIIQCQIREYIARMVRYNRTVKARRLYEGYLNLIGKGPQMKCFRIIYYFQKKIKLNREMIQSWGRIALACSRIRVVRAYIKRLNNAAAQVDSVKMQKLFIHRFMHSFQVAYLYSMNQEKNAIKIKKSNNKSNKINNNSSNLRPNSTPNQTPRSNSISSQKSISSDTNSKTSIIKKKRKLSIKNVQDPTSSTLSRTVVDFMSQEFHTNLFRLRQTGIFIFDTLQTKLTQNEIEYCIQNAHTIFVQAVHSKSNQDCCMNFNGKKIVLCGGLLPNNDVLHFIKYIQEKSKNIENLDLNEVKLVNNGNNNNNNNNTPFSIHFSDVNMSYLSSRRICQFINNKNDIMANLHELSVDSTTFGSLGLAVLLSSLKVFIFYYYY